MSSRLLLSPAEEQFFRFGRVQNRHACSLCQSRAVELDCLREKITRLKLTEDDLAAKRQEVRKLRELLVLKDEEAECLAMRRVQIESQREQTRLITQECGSQAGAVRAQFELEAR